MASFKEVVKSDKESIGGQLPLGLGKAFVLEVSVLELGADINGDLELFGSLSWVAFQKVENSGTGNELSSLLNDSIAYLSDQDHQSGWGVIVLRVLPDQEDGVHDGHEEEVKLGEVSAVHELIEPCF